MGHNLPRQAHLFRTLRVNALSNQEQLHRVLPADLLRHTDGPLDGWHTDAHLREAELGAFAGDDEVTGSHERAGEAQAVAIYRRNGWLPDFDAVLQRCQARRLPVRRPAGPRRVPQIRARAERPPGARHDGDPGLVIVSELRPARVQVHPQLPVDGVQRFRAVVGDRRDVSGAFVKDGAWHGVAPAGSAAQSTAVAPGAVVAGC